MKKILGLDLGTNSIGWALIDTDQKQILGMGSRIIPMSQDILGNFDAGNSVSQTAERTGYRRTRRLRERFLLRRERLHRVLNVLEFLPEHYRTQIDFEKRLGQFIAEKEPKIAYKEVWNEAKNKTEFVFVFQNSFNEMFEDFKANGQDIKIPYDWTIYYLRKKALSLKIEKEELAWLLLNFNQKRGYYQLRGEEEEENPNKLVEFHSLKIVEVVADEKPNSKGDLWYSLRLENGWIYRRSSKTSLFDWKDKVRDFIVTTDLNDDGTVKTDKEGNEKRSFRAPSEDDWTLLKKKTENDLEKHIRDYKTTHNVDYEGTVSTYIYETLLQNPNQKIRGKLVRTIERKFYKDELIAILKKQIELQPELFTENLYNDCIRELYRSNKDRQNELSGKSFVDLFVKDIIFYQRPLRSQKSTIGNCTLEFRIYKDKNGNKIKEYLQAVPKSNPIYQEFRLWQWLFNLKIYRKEDDVDVTSQFVADVTDKESLFDFLNDRKEVKQDALIKYLLEKTGLKGKLLTAEVAKYRWNYVEDKEYPCNQTGTQIKNRLAKVENVPADFFTPEIEYNLWHIIYSVTDKSEFEKALKTFANKHCLDENSFVENFKKFPPFKSEYGAYSEKAIKKLLPLMRLGKYWDLSTIDGKTKNRIDKILTGEYDETIKNRVREKAINLTNETDLQGLQLWLAQYIVYDRHSESNSTNKWNSVADLEKYLEDFRQHSLRNPIVEQVITETLRVVRDIWKKYGELSEIHIELGREMKNTAEDRKKITNQVSENENTNLRIKALIMELKENSDGKLDVKEVRPYSPVQQDILKIYEEYVLQNNEEYDGKDNEGKDKFKKIPIPEDILKISKTAQPSKSELQRYKLWLEQKYRSPYTGQLIPLGKLFTEEYEIEHIIPKSRYFDDSFSNKVICESVVNKNPFKDNQLGLEFIKREGGRIVDALSNKHKTVKIFTETEYRDFVNEHYAKNRSKKVKLLLEEIPDKMIERQMNDTRYISKFISSVLSNIVRIDDDQAKKIIEDAEILAKKETDKEKAEEIRKKAKSAATDDGINSKNLISCNGKITTALKQDWGLNDIWNDLIFPRFERMNALTNSTAFTAWNEQYQKFLPTIPLELSKGFQKKRIDHRHHAMDAIIIACATRSHVNYLNNLSAKVEASDNEEKKKKQIELRNQIKNTLCYKKFDENGNYKWIFKKPWGTDDKQALIKSAIDFTVDARNALGKIVISFKQNLRVINKATNRYKKFKDGKKTEVKQEGINWAIRKPLHKDTAFAKVSLRKIKTIRFNVALKDWKSIVDKELKEKIKRLSSEYGKFDEKLVDKYFKDRKYQFKDVDISKVEVYYFDTDNAAVRKPLDASFTEKTIQESVTDTGIQKILLNHLLAKDNKPELAFSPEGIEEMNKNIAELNGGKSHQPIYKVRVYEPIGNKFPIGYLGNKKAKFVEAAKGTNLFFAIYADKNGNRSYETIPLNIVIERLKQGLKEVPETNEKGHKLLFSLSPNDLVYVPTEEEKENSVNVENINPNQIYKTVSSSGSQCFFVQHLVATSIVNKVEFSALNKMERSIEGIMIKEVGIKIMVDRMGRLKIL